jgi:translation initiation factor 2 subunit 3
MNSIQNLTSHMMKNPIFKIGCLGSVSDGKSSAVRMFTGIETQKDSREKVRNITINQGYGNMKIFKSTHDYITTDSNTDEIADYTLVNHISFVDCPGHMELIKTTLGAIELMDGAIVVIAVDQPLTMKPQLAQHLAAAKLGNLKKIIICMNKIDLVDKLTLMKRKEELDRMLSLYDIKPYIVIPTCFNKKIGFNYIVQAIMELFNPDEFTNSDEPPLFSISRTFDINKPGTNWSDVVGGVIGGSLMKGVININDKLEIRPGIISRNQQKKLIWQPINITVNSIKTDTLSLDMVLPGSLVGLGTDIDPYYCKKNGLVGHVVGIKGMMPNVYTEIKIMLSFEESKLFGFSWIPKLKDNVILKIGTHMSDAKLIEIKTDKYIFELNKPACIRDMENIIVCKEIEKILRVVGLAQFLYSEN